MLRVGLTGGIGAGKSAVAQRLAERGAVIIDADRLAREVVAKGTDGLAEVVAAFGGDVLGADGELDRPALGQRVFGDDNARKRLEAIIHPRVRARTREITDAAPDDAIVVNDVPLLVETGLTSTYHLVLVVRASEPTRTRRLIDTRGMTAGQAAARIAAQASDAQRQAAADVLIDNDGDLAALDAQVGRLWRERLQPFDENLRLGRDAPQSEKLVISDYDPTWPEQAARIMARIRRVAGAHRVHHIGSTAVPGLPAKEVLDLMLAVPTLDDADRLADGLTRTGLPRRAGEWYDNARGNPGQTWPKRLHGSADPARPVNLHVRAEGSPGWRFALLMRDHLRADPQARDDYAEAKRAWQAEHADVGSYADAKEPWFDREAAAAQEWAQRTGWQPPPA